MAVSQHISDTAIGKLTEWLNLTGRRLDWLVALSSLWMVGGAWLDAWSHHRTQLESFFSPAHAILYAGFAATAAVLLAASLRIEGKALSLYSPPGYRRALVGIPLFLAGGLGDAVWHTMFGIEQDVDALLSPTHLILGLGAGLMASGPLIAASQRRVDRTRRLDAPSIVSLGLVVSVVSFFTAFAHPFALPFSAGDGLTRLANFGVEASIVDTGSGFLRQALGVAGILLLAGIVVPPVVYAVLEWRLPAGSLVLVFTVGLGTSALPHEILTLVPAASFAGLATEVLNRTLRPTLNRPVALTSLAVLAPGILVGVYFVAIEIAVGVAWSAELWMGSIFLAGGVGLAGALLLVGVRNGAA